MIVHDPALTIATAVEHSLVELAALFTRGFEGYVVPVRVTAEALAARIRIEAIDLAASRVLSRAGEPVALALVARRGFSSRVAAMGVVKEARRSGAGRLAVACLLDDARARGDARLVLEVIESNEGAVRLYVGAGFRTTRRLVGFRAERVEPDTAPIAACDPSELGRRLATVGARDLPWQLAPESLAQVGAPALAFELDGRAFALVSGVSEQAVGLGAVLTLPEHRRQGLARRLLGAIATRYPARAITFSSIVPEGLANAFFLATGFERMALTQLEMELVL